MQIKVGIDTIQINRIEQILEKFGSRFIDKILHPLEIIAFNERKVNRASYLAKRFSAKEAIAKALGVGIGRLLTFEDMIILNDEFGVPKITIDDNKIQAIIGSNKRCDIEVSMSDDYPIATTCAIATIFSQS